MSCTWIFVTVLMFAPITERSADFTIIIDEIEVGKLHFKVRLKENKSLQAQIRSEYSIQDFRLTYVQENEYDSEAHPIRKYQRVLGTLERSVIASFGKDSVLVVREEGGKRSTQRIPIPKGAEIRAKSEFWFLTMKPSIGKQYEYYRFDLTNLLWHKVRVVYSGKETIQVGEKRVLAHAVTQTDLEGKVHPKRFNLWLDDKGIPLLMIAEDMKVMRKTK